MIFEFVGESGCGKSTLANALTTVVAEAKRKNSFSMRDNLKALFVVFLHRRTRRIFLPTLSLSLSVNGLSRFLKNMMYLAGVVSILTKNEASAVWIMDQGIIQFLQTIYFYSTNMDERCAAIVSRLFGDNRYYVFSCSCDYDTLRKRIAARKENPEEVSRRVENVDKQVIRLHEANMAFILNYIPKDRYLSINTAEIVETNIKKMCDFIEHRGETSCEPKRPY